MTTCFPCSYPGSYKPEAIKWLVQENKICDRHKEKAEGMMEKKNRPLAYREPGEDE